MKIMIADDHPLYVEALVNLLHTDFEIVSKVDNGSKAVMEAREKHPDVILMDINMPGMNGIDATKKILSEFPNIKIIILTCFEERESLFRAIKAGADGYLLKNLDGKEIINGLIELEKGKNPFAPGLEACILQEFQHKFTEETNNVKELTDKLSDRQIEVLQLVAQGLTYREIGKRLFISERTIKYHMEKIKENLNLKTQDQVIALAWQMGLHNTI
ncbi:response regulator transcription factor [Mobilitalea sibirica]|uniref:Stage 0 sporulation protein A homolog n=1 Tax=Mobilitalea sibirica TaxID=1462919 RepID=A0A8J7KVB3_9FIRM|nr:response regulator transcription factor [Mobilitalea sibirica]MBH1939955.1 response regulator transcription factor [Mobilitalea sibirica]